MDREGQNDEAVVGTTKEFPVVVELSEEEQAAVQAAMDKSAAEAAEKLRLEAEAEEKRLADEEAARLVEEAHKALIAEQTPRALSLMRQRHFRGGLGHGDIDAVLASFDPEALRSAAEAWNVELEKSTKEKLGVLMAMNQGFSTPQVHESKPKRRR